MSKLIAMVLLAATSLVIQTSGDIRVSRYKTRNPFTLAVGSSVYTVSKYPTYIKIHTDNELAPSCNIVVDPVKDQISDRITAAALWRKIIVWGERSQGLIDNGKTRQTNYTVLLIDVKRCTYQALSDLVDEMPVTVGHIPPAVLVHRDSFDIFFPSQKKCSPCSYDFNGEKIAAPEQLKHVVKPAAPFYIQELEDLTYVYLYNFDNGTAVLRRLYRWFEDVEPIRLKIHGTVDKLSVSSGEKGTYVGVDYSYRPRKKDFVMFNGKLDTLYVARIPLIDNYAPIRTLVSIDSHGNSYVTVVQKSQLDKSRKITLVRYNAKGHLVDERDLAEFKEDKNYDVQGLLVIDSHYCLVIHEIDDEYKGTTQINCLQVA